MGENLTASEGRSSKGYYNIDGKDYISVTTVLSHISKPGLYYWYGKHGTQECERIKKESAEIGTTVHGLISRHILGGKVLKKDLKNKKVANAYKSFLLWYKQFDVTPDTLTVVDFKTSDYYDKGFELQLAAYINSEPVRADVGNGWQSELQLVNKADGYAGTTDFLYIPLTPSKKELVVVQLGKEEIKVKETRIADQNVIENRYRTFLALKQFVELWKE